MTLIYASAPDADTGEVFAIDDRPCQGCNFPETYRAISVDGTMTAWCPDCEVPIDPETGAIIMSEPDDVRPGGAR